MHTDWSVVFLVPSPRTATAVWNCLDNCGFSVVVERQQCFPQVTMVARVLSFCYISGEDLFE